MGSCTETKKRFIIIGGGSAAFAAAIKASEFGAEVTLINDGLPIGGTCVNVGCVPSKTLIRAAEVNHKASHNPFEGIITQGSISDFQKIIAQKTALVEQLRKEKYIDVVSDLPNFQRIDGRARLLDKNIVEVNGQKLEADKILIATGAKSFIPEIPGLDEVEYLTNDTAFELQELPESLIVVGGRYIALESAQMFARLGSKVTILQRSSRILPTETEDMTSALTKYLEEEGITVVTDVSLHKVRKNKGKVQVIAEVKDIEQTFESSHILFAAGRQPNTEHIGLEQVGIEINSKGFIEVNELLETSIPNIYAAGDVIGDNMFVYTAAYEGGLAAENAFLKTKKKTDYSILPWVIFTDPQVAGIGIDEEQASKRGTDVDISVLPLSYVPRSIAARDTRGFIKLIRSRTTDQLVGARILAPEGSELLMEIALAMKYRIPTKELASFFHPYLTLSEGIKLAAISFEKPVEKLSCCAT